MPRNQGALSRLAELMRRVNSSTDTEVILEEIAHGVVDVLGYGVAAIARLEGDTLVMTHVAGPPEVVAQILHRRTPAEQILDEFREADRWGILRFVPAGRMSPSSKAGSTTWSVDQPSTHASATVRAPNNTLPSVERVKTARAAQAASTRHCCAQPSMGVRLKPLLANWCQRPITKAITALA